MNEKAIQDAYKLFQGAGYGKSIDEFKNLMSSNQNALNDAYKLFQGAGYGKSVDDFKVLMGSGASKEEPLKKKDSTVSDSKLEKPISVSSSKQAETKVDVKAPVKKEDKFEVYKGYTGKEDKEYRFDSKSNIWYETKFSPGPSKQGGKEMLASGATVKKDATPNLDLKSQYVQIKDPSRVKELNKYFGKQGSTSDAFQTFVGYPGKEKNEYRVSNGNWLRRQPGETNWVTITNEGSISSLNNQFGKDVKPFTDKKEVEKVKDYNNLEKQFEQNLSSINSKMIDMSEEAAVPQLQKLFPAFTFEQSKAGADRVMVTAPNGVKKEFLLDNYTWSEDKAQADSLRGFLIGNYDAKLAKEQADLRAVEQTTEDKVQRTVLPGGGSVTTITPSVVDRGVAFPIIEQEAKKERAEYQQAKSEHIKDIYDRYSGYVSKTGKTDDLEARQALSELKADDTELKRINAYQDDIKTDIADFSSKKQKAAAYLSAADAKLKSGEINQAQYDAQYKPEIERMEADLKTQQDRINKETQNIGTIKRSTERAAAENYLIQSAKGSFGGGVAYSFAKGFTYLPRLAGGLLNIEMKDLDKQVAKELGLYTTEEYIQSEDRSDIAKSAFSLVESLGAMASGGGSATAATAIALYGMGYYELKDELDQVEGMTEQQKMIMAGAYGLVSSALERFGLEFALGKTGAGKAIKTSIMRNVFSSLPKDAPKEVIEAAIMNETKKYLTGVGVDIAGSMIVEGGTEALQSLTGAGVKELYDAAKGTNYFNKEGAGKVFEDALYEGYLGALGGGIMSTVYNAGQVGVRGMKANSAELALLMEAAQTEGMDQAVLSNLKADILSGKISTQEAKSIAKNFNEVKSKVAQMPDGLSTEGKSAALSLMFEKDDLNKQIEGKDPNLVKPQKDRIAEIDNRLQEIGKEYAVQEQSTDEVPVQSGAGVGQEMGQGVSQPTGEQVTGEGEQAQTALSEKKKNAIEREKSSLNDTISFYQNDLNNTPRLNMIERSVTKSLIRETKKSLKLLESDPKKYAEKKLQEESERDAEGNLTDEDSYNQSVDFLNIMSEEDTELTLENFGEFTGFTDEETVTPVEETVTPVEETVTPVEETVTPVTETAPVVEETAAPAAQVEEQLSPEVKQELDTFEQLLADEGLAFEEVIDEEAAAVAAEVDEEVVVPAPPSRRGRGVSSKTPTQAAPAAAPAPAKKKTKKQLAAESKERFIADIDAKIKSEKQVSSMKRAELENQKTRAYRNGNNQLGRELADKIEDERLASNKRLAELEAKKANPSALARFRKRAEEEERKDTRNSESKITKEMNRMTAEEQAFEEPTVSGEAELNPVEDSKQPKSLVDKVLKFLGLKSKDEMLRKIEDFDGIPMIMAMSDILSGGSIQDSMGNSMVVDGGLLFNTFGRNMELAWAGVTEDGAQKQYEQAVAVYNANKELFDRLWAEGKIPKGHIPMAVMRMGNTAINSNEAVFRYVLPYIESLPIENREAALNQLKDTLRERAEGNAASVWYTELSEKIDNGELATKEDIFEYIQNIITTSNVDAQVKSAKNFLNLIKRNNKDGSQKTLEDIVDDVNQKIEKIVPYMILNYIEKNNITTLDGFFNEIVEQSKKRAAGEANMFSLPIRAFIYNQFFSKESSEEQKAKQKQKGKVKTNNLDTIKVLLNGVENPRNELFTSDFLYSKLGDPSMMKSKMGDVVAVMGIDVLNGGVGKAKHNNYGFGPKGRLISFISNPKQGVDVFPEFRAKAARVFKKNKKGEYPNTQAVADQTGGAFFMDSAFRGTKARFGKIGDLDLLIGKLRFAFPEVSVTTTEQEFNDFLDQEGVRTRESDGTIIYGVTKDGRIFLNPNFDTLRTPIHEFGHIWMDYLRSPQSGPKGKALLKKGLELVDGTPEYKRALKEYGDRDLALEEALVELMATKGDTIINAAKKSKFKSWMNATFKYIKEQFITSKKFKKENIESLTLDEFINIGLADLFSGERVSGKFDARTAEGGTKARASKQGTINAIVDVARRNNISDDAIKAALKKRGFSNAEISDALNIQPTAQPTTQEGAVAELDNLIANVKGYVQEYARSARNKVRFDIKQKRRAVADSIRAMQAKGSITAKQTQLLLDKVGKLNLSNSESVQKFLDFAERVFKNAEYAESISTINKELPVAKRNLRSKLGIAENLVPMLQRLFAVTPTHIPADVFEKYKAVVDMIGQRKAVLELSEIQQLTDDVQEIFDAIEAEQGMVDELAERFYNYENKVLNDNGDVEYADTLAQMLNEGEITEVERDLMKKYRGKIVGFKERTKKTEAELQDEKDAMIDSLTNSTIESDKLPTRDEQVLAKRIARLIKSGVLSELSNRELTDLVKVVDNINNGYITHRAQTLFEKMTALSNKETLMSPLKRVKVMFGELTKAKIKNSIKARNIYKSIIDGNSAAFIDEVFGNFKTKPIYETVYEPIAKAISSFNSDNRMVQDRINKIQDKLINHFKRNPNKYTMSKYKMMTYLIQLEFESNPNSKQVNQAMAFLKKTIEQTNKEKTDYKERDIDMFNEIIDKYSKDVTDADGKVTQEIDIEKLFNSFSDVEKSAITEIRDINSSMTEKAVFTAAVIRGSRINPINNYISLSVIDPDTATDQFNDINELRNTFGAQATASTRAKTLIERTGGVNAINFDPFSSVKKSSSAVLMDYHMTAPIRQGRMTMSQLEKSVDNNELPENKRPLVNALRDSFNGVVDVAIGNSFLGSSFWDETANEIARQGYRAMLASVPRMMAETMSNMSYIMFKGGAKWIEGSKYGKLLMSTDAFEVLKNVGSVQTSRIYSSNTMSNQFVSSEIFNQTAGLKGSKAKGAIANASQLVYNQTLKRVKNSTELVADALISTPDKLMIRPLWFGSFAAEFKKQTGKDVDFGKIAENDSAYIEQNADAIEQARKAADNETIKAGSSDNVALGIMRNTAQPNDKFISKWYKKFNSFMAKFLLFEYMTARSAVMSLYNNGELTKREAVAQLAAVVSRMTVYNMAGAMLSESMINLFVPGDDDDEEDKSVAQNAGRALTSTFTTLMFGRNFGNAFRAPMNVGIEYMNEMYLDVLRNGDYDPYEDAIQFTITPKQKEGQQQKGVSLKEIAFNTLGPSIPFIKASEYSFAKMTEPDKKTDEALERQRKERLYRVPLEVAGALGYVPLYKDIKKIQMEFLYGNLGKVSVKSRAQAEEMISSAKSSLKKDYQEIAIMESNGEISSQEAKEMSEDAELKYGKKVEDVIKALEKL